MRLAFASVRAIECRRAVTYRGEIIIAQKEGSKEKQRLTVRLKYFIHPGDNTISIARFCLTFVVARNWVRYIVTKSIRKLLRIALVIIFIIRKKATRKRIEPVIYENNGYRDEWISLL